MKIISFNKDGGPICVTVSAGEAQTGSYEFRLWEADKNDVVMKKSGNFNNSDEDTYELPTPNDLNIGRQVQAIVVLALLPPSNDYSATMSVMQDDEELGKVTMEGSSDQPSVSLNLYAELEDDDDGKDSDEKSAEAEDRTVVQNDDDDDEDGTSANSTANGGSSA